MLIVKHLSVLFEVFLECFVEVDNKPIGFLSPQTDVQIKQSEGNLAAQYTSLASQQNSGVQKALDQMRQERVRVMAANLQMDLDLMDQVRSIGKGGGGGSSFKFAETAKI